jgi:hypothetical protein
MSVHAIKVVEAPGAELGPPFVRGSGQATRSAIERHTSLRIFRSDVVTTLCPSSGGVCAFGEGAGEGSGSAAHL